MLENDLLAKFSPLSIASNQNNAEVAKKDDGQSVFVGAEIWLIF